MRFISKIFLISAVLILFASLVYTFFLAFSSGGIDYEINEQRAYFYLGQKTKQKDLERLKLVFKEKGNIDIDYSGSSFARNGQLLRLKLSVNTNKGSSSGTSCSPFKPVVYEHDAVGGSSSIGSAKKNNSYSFY